VHTTHHLIGTTTVEHTADDFENRICNKQNKCIAYIGLHKKIKRNIWQQWLPQSSG